MDADLYMDRWIGAILAKEQVAGGASPTVLAARNPGSFPAIAGQSVENLRGNRSLRWTPKEDEFLRQNLGFLSEIEIGRALGRTHDAVHIRAERQLGLPRPLKDPRYITLNKIAITLGVDSHKVASWVNRGFFPAETVPFRGSVDYRRVLRMTFLVWAINPLNWVWFDPENVPDPRLRRLLALRKACWGDEWWTTNQVAAYHDVEPSDVVRYIKHGRLPAVRTPNRGGRDQDRGAWTNLYILRSEATRPGLHFIKKGKGVVATREEMWPPSLDSFLIFGSAVGLGDADLSAMCGWSRRHVAYRLESLRRGGAVAVIIRDGLPVQYRDRGDGRLILWADWREYRGRFPYLARAMRQLGEMAAGRRPVLAYSSHPGNPRSRELLTARSVLTAWADWFAVTPEQQAVARSVTHGNVQGATMVRALRKIQAWGVDPVGLSG